MAKLKVNEVEANSTNADVKVITKGSTGALEVKGNSASEGTLQLNCSAQSHGVKLKAPSNSADLGYTMTLPDNQIAASKGLRVKSVTNNNAQLEYSDFPSPSIAGLPLDASNLTSGTVPTSSIPTFPASTGLGLKLISSQEVTASNVSQIEFTGLENNAMYHVTIKHLEWDTTSSSVNIGFGKPDGVYWGGILAGMLLAYTTWYSGYRYNLGLNYYAYAPIGFNNNGSNFSDGPMAGDFTFYTGDTNAVAVNGTTRYGFWGVGNGWAKGFAASTEVFLGLRSGWRESQISRIKFYLDSGSYRPNRGCKILLYKYMES